MRRCDLQFRPAPEARPQPNQQGNYDAAHGSWRVSAQTDNLNVFSVYVIYGRHNFMFGRVEL